MSVWDDITCPVCDSPEVNSWWLYDDNTVIGCICFGCTAEFTVYLKTVVEIDDVYIEYDPRKEEVCSSAV